jgi:hypothetical protein
MLVDLDRRLGFGLVLVVIVEACRHRGRIVFHAQDLAPLAVLCRPEPAFLSGKIGAPIQTGLFHV